MPSPYHHGDLRNALLAAAAELLVEHGPGALTLRALAERTGVSRSAPYRHFADKDALLATLAADGFRDLRAALDAAREAAPDAADRLIPMAEAYVAFALAHPAQYRLMYGRDALERRSERPGLQAEADALFDDVVIAIRRHQSRGEIRPGPPEPLAYVVWAAVHGLALLLVEGQMVRPAEPAPLIRLTAETVLFGLRP